MNDLIQACVAFQFNVFAGRAYRKKLPDSRAGNGENFWSQGIGRLGDDHQMRRESRQESWNRRRGCFKGLGRVE